MDDTRGTPGWIIFASAQSIARGMIMENCLPREINMQQKGAAKVWNWLCQPESSPILHCQTLHTWREKGLVIWLRIKKRVRVCIHSSLSSSCPHSCGSLVSRARLSLFNSARSFQSGEIITARVESGRLEIKTTCPQSFKTAPSENFSSLRRNKIDSVLYGGCFLVCGGGFF